MDTSEPLSLDELYGHKVQCQSCRLRAACTQVVPATGCRNNPKLLIVGESPGGEEDKAGEPFIGPCGQALREVLRGTGVINRTNTLITNVLGCKPNGNIFPKDECPSICVSQWLAREIQLAKPQRMLLLGGQALKYVAGMEGIKNQRGKWYEVRGVRTIATYHPSYVMRCDRMGDMMTRRMFERDIQEVAKEVKALEGR